MIKNIENQIKKAETFIEFWTKFNHLFNDAMANGMGVAPERESFVSTSLLVNTRFEELMDTMKVSSRDRMKKCYPIYEILSINDFNNMSDEKLDRIKDCWNDSFVYLYSMLDRCRKKKKKVEKLIGFNFFAKLIPGRRGQ